MAEEQKEIRREYPGDFKLDELVAEKVFAERLGLSVSVTRRLRGRGLPYYRIGGAMSGRVYVNTAEALQWILANCRTVSSGE